MNLKYNIEYQLEKKRVACAILSYDIIFLLFIKCTF